MKEQGSLGGFVFAAKSAFSLIRNKPDSFLEHYRKLYQEMSQVKFGEPLNRDEEILPQFLRVAEERNLFRNQKNGLKPYWRSKMEYDTAEVFGTLIQFLDEHEGSLPATVLPPERDVQKYINRIMQRDGRVTIVQQFKDLLDVTNNNLLGAANLGFIASRLMARGHETRAYPNICVKEKEMRGWNNKISQFEIYHDSDRADGPGDTYYFWTYVFLTIFVNQHEPKPISKKVNQLFFEHGTEIMRFVKDKVAHRPIITDIMKLLFWAEMWDLHLQKL